MIIGTFRLDEIKIGRQKTTENGEIITIRHPFADKLNELRNYTKKENHTLANPNWFYETELNELTITDIKSIINIQFKNNLLPESFFNDIFKLTNGHPLFLVEIVDYLKENNIITQNEQDVYELKNFELQELPISVNAGISEKLERLDENLKKILSYASISGEKFIIQEIEKILKIDEFDLLDFLEILNQKYDILTEEEAIIDDDLMLDMYSFSQTLVHRFVYDNIDNIRRRRLHKHVAATIKSLWGEKIEYNAHVFEKYNQHLQISQGIINSKTLLISNIEPISAQSNSLIYQSLIEASKIEIEKASQNAKLLADEETVTHAEKALAFLSKIKEKNEQTEKLRFEAFYYKWQAYFSSKKIKLSNRGKELSRIANELANIADFFEKNNTASAQEYFTRVAMTFTLIYDYEKANKYFYKEYNSLQKYSSSVGLDETIIEKLVREKKYDEASDIYLNWQKKTGFEVYEDELILNIGIALAKNKEDLYLQKAEKFLTYAYMVAEDNQDRYDFTVAAYYNGVIKYKLKKYKEAKYYLEIAKIRYERWKNPKSTYCNWEWDDIYSILDEILKIENK
ncbi:MAG: hypothetical protein JXR68_09570 [Bacteroidales bacterium]|nr:hypothetical protein [Bacteroidales bacterium]